MDETGDRKRGHGIPFAAQQYIGKLGFTANGVVSVTSQWTDGTRHVPLGVKPFWPASRLPGGKQDPQFRIKPELAFGPRQAVRLIAATRVIHQIITRQRTLPSGKLVQSILPSWWTTAPRSRMSGSWRNSFQAPDFYRRLGYEVYGALTGYPSGHSKIFLKKQLQPDGT